MGSTKVFDVEAFAKTFAATFVAGLQQLPEADKPAKRVSRQEVISWEPTAATLLLEGDTISRKADGKYPRLITDLKVRSNGSILLGVESTDDCSGLILQPESVIYRRTVGYTDKARSTQRVVEAEAAKPKASKPKAKKGRYSSPATKVQLRVVFDKASLDYGLVAEDCITDGGVVLARQGWPLDMVLNGLRTYNEQADKVGAPIYGFTIVGRNGNAVKAASLAAGRKASAAR